MNMTLKSLPFFPQPKVKPGELTRTERKIARKRDEENALADCYRKVDARDGRRCRISGVRVSPGAVDPRVRGVHHHLRGRRFRSLVAAPGNVVLVSQAIHEKIHAGLLRVSGDADLRDSTGRLAGLCVERLKDSGWEVWKCC